MSRGALLWLLCSLAACSEVGDVRIGDDVPPPYDFENCLTVADGGMATTLETFICICDPALTLDQLRAELMAPACFANPLSLECLIGRCFANIDKLREERARQAAADAGPAQSP